MLDRVRNRVVKGGGPARARERDTICRDQRSALDVDGKLSSAEPSRAVTREHG
jgi:hypothetical protein